MSRVASFDSLIVKSLPLDSEVIRHQPRQNLTLNYPASSRLTLDE